MKQPSQKRLNAALAKVKSESSKVDEAVTLLIQYGLLRRVKSKTGNGTAILSASVEYVLELTGFGIDWPTISKGIL